MGIFPELSLQRSRRLRKLELGADTGQELSREEVPTGRDWGQPPGAARGPPARAERVRDGTASAVT